MLQVTPIQWQQICCNLASTKSPEKFIPSPPSTGIPARWHERTMAVFTSSIESQKSTAANNRIWAAASMRRKRPQARAVICWPVTIKILAKTASSVSDNTRSVYKAVSTIDGSEPCQNLTRHQIWCSRIDTPSTRRPSSCYKAKHQKITPPMT